MRGGGVHSELDVDLFAVERKKRFTLDLLFRFKSFQSEWSMHGCRMHFIPSENLPLICTRPRRRVQCVSEQAGR